MHTLTAVATATDGETAKATLLIDVATPGCMSDADCTNGNRCCVNDGTCNPPVAAGADCDCDHPCPSSQGCFPGICGSTPAKCYPGCYPGSDGDATHPNGQLPDSCPDQAGQPAFCNPLPASQVTAANKGGACVVGDNCNVTTQNCPMLPLDRSQPQGANNPLVKYNCLPVAPNLNGCFPAGTKTSGQANCDQVCGTVAAGTAAVQDNCAPGYECVQPVDSTGTPRGPAACAQQCASPSTTGNPSNQCSISGDTCIGVYQPYGQYMVNFTTGSCCGASLASSCSQGTDCCSGSCGSLLPGNCD
jgi:hypothetical protein